MSGSNVRIEKLGADNYEVWRTEMRCYILHNKTWHAVQFAQDAVPSKADAEHACTLILLHVERMHYATIQRMNNARDVWEALERTSRRGKYARKLRLRLELHKVVKSSSEGIQSYVARPRRICVHLMAWVSASVMMNLFQPVSLACPQPTAWR
jgi:hypothetical protein